MSIQQDELELRIRKHKQSRRYHLKLLGEGGPGHPLSEEIFRRLDFFNHECERLQQELPDD